MPGLKLKGMVDWHYSPLAIPVKGGQQWQVSAAPATVYAIIFDNLDWGRPEAPSGNPRYWIGLNFYYWELDWSQWPIHRLEIENGSVARQVPVKGGIYTFPRLVDKSVEYLIGWLEEETPRQKVVNRYSVDFWEFHGLIDVEETPLRGATR